MNYDQQIDDVFSDLDDMWAELRQTTAGYTKVKPLPPGPNTHWGKGKTWYDAATIKLEELREALRPDPVPEPEPEPVSSRFGMQLGGAQVYWHSEAERNRELDGIVASGASWYRLDIYWALIEKSPGVYDWSLHDAVIKAARERGLNVLGAIAYTPAWARPAGTSDKHPPTDLSRYASFAKEVAKHYAPMGVHHWEIWNEPNIHVFWEPSANAARYTAMLTLAYTAIKSADPNAFVMTGGTAPAGGWFNSGDPKDINTLRFLEGIYAAGGAAFFDAVAHHPYSFPYLPSNPQPDIAWNQVVNSTPSLRSIMVAHGDGDKQIWGTEFGGATNGPGAVSESAQATIITQGYQAWLGYEWAGPLFVYCYRDTGTATDNRENFFGLVRFDFTPKPALASYQAVQA